MLRWHESVHLHVWNLFCTNIISRSMCDLYKTWVQKWICSRFRSRIFICPSPVKHFANLRSFISWRRRVVPECMRVRYTHRVIQSWSPSPKPFRVSDRSITGCLARRVESWHSLPLEQCWPTILPPQCETEKLTIAHSTSQWVWKTGRYPPTLHEADVRVAPTQRSKRVLLPSTSMCNSFLSDSVGFIIFLTFRSRRALVRNDRDSCQKWKLQVDVLPWCPVWVQIGCCNMGWHETECRAPWWCKRFLKRDVGSKASLGLLLSEWS